MKGQFKVLIGGNLKIFHDANDIPEKFDNLIEFLPEYPPGPHTEKQHEEMESFMEIFRELMERETK